MAIIIGNYEAQAKLGTLLVQTWARVGSTATPTNVTAGAAPDPHGTITSVANRTPYFKFGGAAT
jgi:hypothetical protein